MKSVAVIRVLAFVLAIVALAMLPSLLIAAVDGQPSLVMAFIWPITGAASLAFLARLFGRGRPLRFSYSDGFRFVASAWFTSTLLGALPFKLSGFVPKLAAAVFESASGFTTTGASILSDIEALPRALLFWRAMTQWLGGMGIVVLTVALLPLLGVGGFQLVKAEVPGPEKDKIAPKITESAKILWFIYIALTALNIIFLMLGGMNGFEASCLAFVTIATGGFSLKNANVGHYQSAWIEVVCTVFMLLAGINFSLYYKLIRGKLTDLVNNSELKAYIGIFVVASLTIGLSLRPIYGSFGSAFRQASFQTASILTTAGLASSNFDLWPAFAKAVLFILMFIGGCSGSTSGGIKVIRHVVLFKQAANEMGRLLFPRAVFSVRLNGKVGRKDVVYGTAGFVFVYLAALMVIMLVIASAGADLISALTGALATVGNIGFGFGLVGPTMNYAVFPDYVIWVLSLAMIVGRLELWTVLVLFKRELWQR